MKIKPWFFRANSFPILIRKITKPLQMFLVILVILFVMQVPVAFGQWFVWEFNCYPSTVGCHSQRNNAEAIVNFRVTFTNIFAYSYGAGWAGTIATCPNGATVQNNAEATNEFFWIGYDHYSYELNRFNRIFTTIAPGTLQPTPITGTLIYTPAVTLYFPELCSPPTGGGGGCGSGVTITGEKFSKDDSPNRCSMCNPDPYELNECFNSGGTYDYNSCFCGQSPIVIDVLGNGFNLTNAVSGVRFDINGDGVQEQIAWTSADSDDVWLALDRNGNNTIDNGKELFGNHTPQPAPPAGEQKNGFLALAIYDKPANGGNNDGQIDSRDSVFSQLKLWQDTNHNGISETSEMQNLSASAIRIIELDYRESRRTDEHGNRFRYRAKVKDAQGAQIGRWAWDVFLATAP